MLSFVSGTRELDRASSQMRPTPRAFVEASPSLGWPLPELGLADRTARSAHLTVAT